MHLHDIYAVYGAGLRKPELELCSWFLQSLLQPLSFHIQNS